MLGNWVMHVEHEENEEQVSAVVYRGHASGVTVAVADTVAVTEGETDTEAGFEGETDTEAGFEGDAVVEGVTDADTALQPPW